VDILWIQNDSVQATGHYKAQLVIVSDLQRVSTATRMSAIDPK